jgi:hypothetical protein
LARYTGISFSFSQKFPPIFIKSWGLPYGSPLFN